MPLNNLLKFDLSQPSLKANTAQAEFVPSALQALAWQKSSFKRLGLYPYNSMQSLPIHKFGNFAQY